MFGGHAFGPAVIGHARVVDQNVQSISAGQERIDEGGDRRRLRKIDDVARSRDAAALRLACRCTEICFVDVDQIKVRALLRERIRNGAAAAWRKPAIENVSSS